MCFSHTRTQHVHLDFKPANFILANGTLKIADFGISNALPDDTVNVYQEHQAGTPNYMAPETLKALSQVGSQPVTSRAFRFGNPSDLWSLGCIKHLIVYGRPTFGHIQGLAPKLMAIVLESRGVGGVQVPLAYTRTMKACLSREPDQRPTADDLLQHCGGLLEELDSSSNSSRLVHVTSSTVEVLMSNAIRDAGVSASPEEIEAWAGKVMRKLNEGR